jgi:hypothetical protein
MPEDESGQQRAQTTPKGAEIPVPKRSEFLRNMEKVAPPAKPEDEREDDSTGRVARRPVE